MEKVLKIASKVCMVFGIITIFIVTAVIAGVGLGVGIAYFEGGLANGEVVKGVGIINDAQAGGSVIGGG